MGAPAFAATCNAHGASEPAKQAKVDGSHSEQLRSADIVVFNDNDAAGYAHADATCKLSLGIAKRVRRLDLAQPHWPDIPKGGDVSDWLAAGHSGDELRALIERAPERRRPPMPPTTQHRPPTAPRTTRRSTRLARLGPLHYEHERKRGRPSGSAYARRSWTGSWRGERAELGLDGDDGRQGHAIACPEARALARAGKRRRTARRESPRRIRRHVVDA